MGQILKTPALGLPVEGLGIPLGSIDIEMFDNGGQLLVRVNFPVGDGKGGVRPEQRDIYMSALHGALDVTRKAGPGKLQAMVGPNGDLQAPVAGRRNLG